PRSPRARLVPYTTLFRSQALRTDGQAGVVLQGQLHAPHLPAADGLDGAGDDGRPRLVLLGQTYQVVAGAEALGVAVVAVDDGGVDAGGGRGQRDQLGGQGTIRVARDRHQV